MAILVVKIGDPWMVFVGKFGFAQGVRQNQLAHVFHIMGDVGKEQSTVGKPKAINKRLVGGRHLWGFGNTQLRELCIGLHQFSQPRLLHT